MEPLYSVFSFEKPSPGDWEDFPPSAKFSLVWEGDRKGTDLTFFAFGQGLRWRRSDFESAGPFPLEEADLPEQVGKYVFGPRWVVSISLGENRPFRFRKGAEKWAVHLARKRTGAVWDHRAGKVVWPGKKVTPPKIQVCDRDVPMVVFSWNFLERKEGEGKARLFLDVFRKGIGLYTPFFFGFPELERHWIFGNPEKFLDAWKGCLENDGPIRLDFEVDPPFYNPEVLFGSAREGTIPGVETAGLKRVRAQIHLHAGTFAGHPSWREFIVSFFAKVARRLGAFYSIAYLERGYILDLYGIDGLLLKDSNLYSCAETEDYPIVRGPDWSGLPPCPGWLVWFGPPYSGRVGPALGRWKEWARSRPGTSFQEAEDGLFLRMGLVPPSLDELEGVPYDLPGELLDKTPPPHPNRDYLDSFRLPEGGGSPGKEGPVT